MTRVEDRPVAGAAGLRRRSRAQAAAGPGRREALGWRREALGWRREALGWRRRGAGPAAAPSGAPGRAGAVGASPSSAGHGPANEVLLACLVGVLIVVGLVMVLSASSVEALRQYGSSWMFFEHQVLWTVLGLPVMALAARIDYRTWRRVGGPLLVGCVVLLLAVLVPHVGVTVSGSSRWLGAGSLSFQPSELTKLAVAIFGADVLARRARAGQPWGPAIRPVVIVLAVTGLLILEQPDMGTALLLACVCFGLLYAAGTPPGTMAKLACGAVGAAVLAGLALPYRRARLLSFVDPWAHRSTSGYQVVQSLVGFASGHLWGVGLGASRAKWGFLPNAHTDFIFAIIGEELGLIGSLLVVALFVALALVGLRVAARAPERFGSLLASAITCWFIGQAVLNIGAVIGLLPVTGVPLPFVSYGGSSLVIEMAAVGILLNVAVQGSRRQLRAPARPAGGQVLAFAPRAQLLGASGPGQVATTEAPVPVRRKPGGGAHRRSRTSRSAGTGGTRRAGGLRRAP